MDRWGAPTQGPSKSVIEYLLGTDLFGTSAGRKPISQVVLLGAGMDTRVFRLRTKSGTVADVAFEVDMPEVLNAKQAVLEKCDESLTQLTLVKRRVSVGVDLNHPKWSETLLAAGFDPTAPTVWLAEGLTMYLEPHAMAALTATLHELSAPHSVLLVSMVNATAVAKAQVRRLRLSKRRLRIADTHHSRGYLHGGGYFFDVSHTHPSPLPPPCLPYRRRPPRAS